MKRFETEEFSKMSYVVRVHNITVLGTDLKEVSVVVSACMHI